MALNVNEKQVGGNHYKTKFQHWDLLIEVGFGPQYFVGQATKYISRWRKKHGVADLRKGQHFIEKWRDEASRSSRQWFTYPVDLDQDVLARFGELNGLTGDEVTLIHWIFNAEGVGDLTKIINAIDAMAAESFLDGTYSGAVDGFKPAAVGFKFLRYGEGHNSIVWMDLTNLTELELPIDKPPSR